MIAATGRWRSIALFVLGAVAVALVPVLVFGDDYRLSIIAAGTALAIAVFGMDLLIGYGRQLALATPVFVAVGAYGAALASTRYEVHPLVGLAASLIVSAVLAYVIGFAVHRFAELGLLVVSLLVYLAIADFVQHSDYFGNTFGLGPVEGLPNSVRSSPIQQFALVTTVAALVAGYLRWLGGGAFGRALIAVGGDSRAARASGLRAAELKHVVFVLSSVIATIGGFVYAHLNGYVSPEIMTLPLFLQMVLALFVGGRKTIWAGGAAFVVLYYLPHAAAGILQWRLFMYGALFIAVLVLFPSGAAGAVAWTRARIRGARSTSAGVLGDGAEPRHLKEIAPALADLYDREAARPTTLAADCVSQSFGGVVALDQVTCAFSGPGVTGVLGPNGAGKSTLFDILAGELIPTSGRVLLDGTDVSSERAAARAVLGMARTFQTTRLFAELTVVENVALGARPFHERGSRANVAWYRGNAWWRAAVADADRLVTAFGLDRHRTTPVVDLPIGARRLVELARAVVSRPSLLLLDEPASGLDDGQRAVLADVVSVIGEHAAVVLVEHDVDFVARTASQVVLLTRGAVQAVGTPAEVRASEVAQAEYFGVASPARPPADGPRSRRFALEVTGLSVRYGHVPAVRDASLRVEEGGILLITGDNGAGKTSLINGIAGIVRTEGSISAFGEPLRLNDPVARQRAGISLVPEGRALFRTMSVRDNLLLGAAAYRRSERQLVRSEEWRRVLELFPILGERLDQRAGTLSGGQQQMLTIGRALMGRPRLVMLDEPGHGLAPATVDTIYEAVSALRSEGVTVVIAEESGRVREQVGAVVVRMERGTVRGELGARA